jgi:type IV pilus biogenesis protein CpaD/CtpE
LTVVVSVFCARATTGSAVSRGARVGLGPKMAGLRVAWGVAGSAVAVVVAVMTCPAAYASAIAAEDTTLESELVTGAVGSAAATDLAANPTDPIGIVKVNSSRSADAARRGRALDLWPDRFRPSPRMCGAPPILIGDQVAPPARRD